MQRNHRILTLTVIPMSVAVCFLQGHIHVNHHHEGRPMRILRIQPPRLASLRWTHDYNTLKALNSDKYSEEEVTTTTTTTTANNFKISSSSRDDGTATQRAGTAGYSIVRQPLSWDIHQDPVFNVPSSIQDTNKDEETLQTRANSQWWEYTTRDKNNKKISVPQSRQEPTATSLKEDDDPILHSTTLDLFQRTLDTLDYQRVLAALQQECITTTAKDIIAQSQNHASIYAKNYTSHHKPRFSFFDSHVPLDSIYDMGLTAQSTEEINLRYNSIREMQTLLDGIVDAPSEYIATLKAKAQSQRGSSSSSTRHASSSSISTRFKKMGIVPILDNTLDLQPIWDTLQKGKVCEGPDILDVTHALETLFNVAEWCNALKSIQEQYERGATTVGGGGQYSFQVLPKFGDFIQVDTELYQLLRNALDDETGQLSGTTFPTIGLLRTQIRSLKADILATVNTLLTSSSMKSKLSLESGGNLFSEVNGRIVIPVYDQVSNSVGIVHDVSRSGKTAYCEPTEIVAPTNEMRRAEAELQREEAIVWRMLTKKIIEKEKDIQRSIYAVALLDLIVARIRLGDRLGGVIPQVSNEGVVTLKNAKHPVLILRQVANIVGNDIDFGVGSNKGLILTGPNSGGKTLILKLIGLFALMTRDAIPIPASSDAARVDFFSPVLADIGDIQSVGGDLSTFSGHMLVCREVLSNSGKNALILMDELGSGTDPRQGVAIAQALLEAIVDTGAKVAITTHYFELKQLASSDRRFSVAGMQFVNGRPTYKLLPGVVGESFALSVAERLKLPSDVISRANQLLDTETRQMGDLLRDMETQKTLLDNQIQEMTKKQNDLEQLEIEMKKQQEKLERTQLTARKEEAAKFAEKLREKENVLEEILEKLKSDPSRKVVARSWDDIKYVKRDVLNEVESLASMMRRAPLSAAKDTSESTVNWVPISELRDKPNLNVGDPVYICKTGSFMGKLAKVISVGGNRVDVSVNGLAMSMKMNELAISLTEDSRKDEGKVQAEDNKRSKLARKALLEESLMGDKKGSGRKLSQSSDVSGSNNEPSGSITVRLKTNTIDVLGCTFQDAKQKCEEKFSQVMSQKSPVVYILHGHGTQGVLKEKIRDWLQRDRQWVKKWKPADAADGGDAFTLVELKKLQV